MTQVIGHPDYVQQTMQEYTTVVAFTGTLAALMTFDEFPCGQAQALAVRLRVNDNPVNDADLSIAWLDDTGGFTTHTTAGRALLEAAASYQMIAIIPVEAPFAQFTVTMGVYSQSEIEVGAQLLGAPGGAIVGDRGGIGVIATAVAVGAGLGVAVPCAPTQGGLHFFGVNTGLAAWLGFMQYWDGAAWTSFLTTGSGVVNVLTNQMIAVPRMVPVRFFFINATGAAGTFDISLIKA